MKYVQGPVTTEIIAPDQTTDCLCTLSSTALPLRFGVAQVQDRWFTDKALNTSHSGAGAGYFLAGSFVCGSFLCSSAEPHPGQKEEKMGAALIKAQGRVSSAVNSQLGGAQQINGQPALSSPSTAPDQSNWRGTKRSEKDTTGEAATTCAEPKRAEGERKREPGTEIHDKHRPKL